MVAEPPVLEFAGLLRQLRAQAGLTQEELAEAAGLSPRSVSDLERGINRTARKDTALLLAEALGLADPVRAEFVAAARGRGSAAAVLAAGRRAAREAPPATAGGLHAFPAPLTSFVGRAVAVREVAGLLAEHRLVTVTGPGGAGKTRLAAEVAGRVAGRFADGAWLVELASVQDPAQVAAVVAVALGVRDQPGVTVADALARVLARQQLLLVLDNCEHVIDAAATLCAGLLAVCDDVRILATSREPLAVAGEARYRLGPLAVPELDDLAGVARAEAVDLFADRARSADAHFALTSDTAPAVARLVMRLDGMPLAIELAAARVEALGVTQLLERLDDRFTLLAGGDRLAPSRQRSLAATVAWSYQLLDEQERRVFRAVSVFPGPFMLEAAEAVAGKGAGAAVLHLVDCSLLVPPRPGPDGRSRYGMLETLRAYGTARLAEAGEDAETAAALAGWALGVAEEAAAGLQTTSREPAAARWLDAEDATMRQVLVWALDHDAHLALRLAAALGWWWFLRGRAIGQYPLLCDAVARGDADSQEWCIAQRWLGYMAGMSVGWGPRSLGHFTAARDAAAPRGPSPGLADALAGRSQSLDGMGQTAEAAEEARGSLAAAREAGYPAGEAVALTLLSTAAYRTGDVAEAVRLAWRAHQVPADICGWNARWTSYNLAWILDRAGDLDAALDACAAGLDQSLQAGDLWTQAVLLDLMPVLDLRARRIEDAATHLREEIQLSARLGARYTQLRALDSCGQLCAMTGRPAEAVTLWTVYAALSRHEKTTDRSCSELWPESLRRAREALGPDRSRAAEERGTAMSLDTAAEYALMLTAGDPRRPAAPPRLENLSTRECELVTLVAQGRTDAQIAAQLYISVRTVHTHLDRIRDKTGCRRRADLTRLALQAGLI